MQLQLCNNACVRFGLGLMANENSETYPNRIYPNMAEDELKMAARRNRF